MKKGKTKNQTIHMPGKDEPMLCGKPVANSTLRAKISTPTKEHPGLCKRCYPIFAKAETDAPAPKAKKEASREENA